MITMGQFIADSSSDINTHTKLENSQASSSYVLKTHRPFISLVDMAHQFLIVSFFVIQPFYSYFPIIMQIRQVIFLLFLLQYFCF